MEERTLALDEIPSTVFTGRRDQFDRSGNEVRNHGIHGYAAPGDEDACLSGGAEIRLEAAFAHAALERERGVHLADRAVGAHRQEAPAGSLSASADRDLSSPLAGIEQRTAIALGCGHDVR